MRPSPLSALYAVFGGLWCATGVFAACQADQIEIRGAWGFTHYSIEIADDPREQAKGLMFRRHLAKDSGMLFVYSAPQHTAFWMKNTLIPLDMLFIDDTGRIKRIAQNARPLDETPIDGGAGVKLVLEINGGLSKKTGITIGDQIRHLSISPSKALWPCEP